MPQNPISRRSLLQSLTAATVAGSPLRVISLEAAAYAHRLIEDETTANAGAYAPRFFSPHPYQTLCALCRDIIPADADSAGALEAGAPQFIDLLTSENPDYQLKLGGGLMWLDSTSIDRFGKVYLECPPAQQKQILDLIAYRKNLAQDKTLSQGIEFFSLLRGLTADGFFTSKIGIAYLGYIGNTYLLAFNGCPPVPGV